MSKVAILLLMCCFVFVGKASASCSDTEKNKLKNANWEQQEIDLACTNCSYQDIVNKALSGKGKNEITALCSPVVDNFYNCSDYDVLSLKQAGYDEGDLETLCRRCSTLKILNMTKDGPNKKDKKEIAKECNWKQDKSEDMPAYVLLFTKPLKLGFDSYHSSASVKESKDSKPFETDKKGQDLYNVYFKYSLPISSLYYAFDKTRPEKPNPLLKAFEFYVNGSYGNTTNTDTAGTVPIKIDKTASYQVGFRFETNIETLIQRNKNYKYMQNY